MLSFTPIYSAIPGEIALPILSDWLITPACDIVAFSITTLPPVNEVPDVPKVTFPPELDWINEPKISTATNFSSWIKASLPVACLPENLYLPWNKCFSLFAGLIFKEPVNSKGTSSLGPNDVLVWLSERASKVSATFMSILSPADVTEESKSIKVEEEAKLLSFLTGIPSVDFLNVSIALSWVTSSLLKDSVVPVFVSTNLNEDLESTNISFHGSALLPKVNASWTSGNKLPLILEVSFTLTKESIKSIKDFEEITSPSLNCFFKSSLTFLAIF